MVKGAKLGERILAGLLIQGLVALPMLARGNAPDDGAPDCEGLYGSLPYPKAPTCSAITTGEPEYDKALSRVKAECERIRNSVIATNAGTLGAVQNVSPHITQGKAECIPAAQALVGAGEKTVQGRKTESASFTAFIEADHQLRATLKRIEANAKDQNCSVPQKEVAKLFDNVVVNGKTVTAERGIRVNTLAGQSSMLGTNIKNLIRGCGDEVLIGAGLLAVMLPLLKQLGGDDEGGDNSDDSKDSGKTQSLGTIPNPTPGYNINAANTPVYSGPEATLPTRGSATRGGSGSLNAINPGAQENYRAPAKEVKGESLGGLRDMDAQGNVMGDNPGASSGAGTGASAGGASGSSAPGATQNAGTGGQSIRGTSSTGFSAFDSPSSEKGYVPNQGEALHQNFYAPSKKKPSSSSQRVGRKSANVQAEQPAHVDCRDPRNPRCRFQKDILSDPLLRRGK